MKIALVCHRFLPYHRAGVEVLTHSLARALREKGHHPFVVCSGSVTERDSLVRVVRDSYDGIPVWRLYFNWQADGNYFRSAFRNESVGEAISELLKAEVPELVHVTSCLFLSTTAIEAALRLKLPVVWTLTDYWPICWKTTLLTWNEKLCEGDWKVDPSDCLGCFIAETETYRRERWLRILPASLWARSLYQLMQFPLLSRLVPRLFKDAAEAIRGRPVWFRALVKRVDALVAVNRFAYDLFRECGFPRDRLRLITQTIDPARLIPRQSGVESAKQSEESSGLDSNRPLPLPVRIGFIGRINRVKGADLLVQAFQQSGVGNRGELKLFGQFDDDSFRHHIEGLISRDSRIKFCGSFDPGQLGEVLSQMDVLVVPSRWYETGPLTIVEAFAAKLPVICTKLGEMDSMVQHGVNGFVFERNSVADLAQAIRTICQNPALVARFRQQIGPIIPFDRMVDQYLALYEECLARRSSVEPG
jgi:glycosyltransferase involved in cell wall biosynthesis